MNNAVHVHTSDKNIVSGFENTGREPSDIVHELVDNAIDAKATQIIISCPTERNPTFFVQDNGTGMDSTSLGSVFTPGKSDKPYGSIGGYGDGLKSTFGLAEHVSVLSKYKGHVAGEVYDKARMLDQPDSQYVTFAEENLATLEWAKTQFKHSKFTSGTIVRLSRLQKTTQDWDSLCQILPFTLGVKFYSFLLNRQNSLTIKREGLPDVLVGPLDAMDRHANTTTTLSDEELEFTAHGSRVKARLRSFSLGSDSATDPFSLKFAQQHFGKNSKGKFSAAQGLRVICNGREVAHIHTHEGFYMGHASTNFFRAELVFSGDIKGVVKPTRDKTKIVLDARLQTLLLSHLKIPLALELKRKKDKLKATKAAKEKSEQPAKLVVDEQPPRSVNPTPQKNQPTHQTKEVQVERLQAGFGSNLAGLFSFENDRVMINPKHPLFSENGLSHKDWAVVGTLLCAGLTDLSKTETHQFLNNVNRSAESLMCHT